MALYTIRSSLGRDAGARARTRPMSRLDQWGRSGSVACALTTATRCPLMLPNASSWRWRLLQLHVSTVNAETEIVVRPIAVPLPVTHLLFKWTAIAHIQYFISKPIMRYKCMFSFHMHRQTHIFFNEVTAWMQLLLICMNLVFIFFFYFNETAALYHK